MLQIQPQPSNEASHQHFTLSGVIDIDAIKELESLYGLPDNCAVELDFALVQRVNSMGLAQLLKLFEHWQKHSITLQISNLNRMIGVLFKMTGLTRFIVDGKPATQPAVQANSQAPILPTRPSSTAVKSVSQTTAAALPVSEFIPGFNKAKLQISSVPSDSESLIKYALVGTIDVEAVAILESLYSQPANSKVVLDFAKVDRVNSMGLAQLLKLFEHWQKNAIGIHVINPSRMIGVLFKMTGLLRFLDNSAPPAQPAAPKAEPAQAAPSNAPAANRSGDKIRLLVHAQSSRQMNGWYFFNTYLQRRLGREIHMELSHGAVGESRISGENMDIVFTKPFEATRLILQHDFKGVIRPVDQTDEVTLLVRADDPRKNLKEFQNGKIVTAAQENFVYLLGRFLLEESEESLHDMEYLFSGHDIKALQMLLKGSADILFMLSDTYKGLSSLTRKMLREIDQSETAFAFHLFCVAPHCAEISNSISDVLLDMGMDSQGRQILADLGIESWCKPSNDELDMLFMLFNRYAIPNISNPKTSEFIGA